MIFVSMKTICFLHFFSQVSLYFKIFTCMKLSLVFVSLKTLIFGIFYSKGSLSFESLSRDVLMSNSSSNAIMGHSIINSPPFSLKEIAIGLFQASTTNQLLSPSVALGSTKNQKLARAVTFLHPSQRRRRDGGGRSTLPSPPLPLSSVLLGTAPEEGRVSRTLTLVALVWSSELPTLRVLRWLLALSFG